MVVETAELRLPLGNNGQVEADAQPNRVPVL